ncbi:unnamed protein product [Rhizophagus irregularis]|nr:unnamed protein product [Rhizophagus irregularis]
MDCWKVENALAFSPMPLPIPIKLLKAHGNILKKFKIDASNPDWYSCPATCTETEKERLVKDELAFPFILKQLITLRSNSRISIFKKNKIPDFKRGEKPDFVIVSKQDLLDPLNIMAVGKIRVITAKYGMFSNEDISYATSFGEKLLQLQLF